MMKMENTQMQSDFIQNNRKLEACLVNVQNAIILLEVNDKETEKALISLLEQHGDIETICFQTVKENFIPLLYNMSEGTSLQKVCFYAFDPPADTYDIVKSLNISREILSRIGILIFMMPSILVSQIEYEEPNLRDYILLKLDYTRKEKLPFEPIFSIQYASRYGKLERRNLKVHASKICDSQENPLNRYFHYLDGFQYKTISKQEYEDSFCIHLQEMENYVQNYQWQNNADRDTALLDVWYKTAKTLAAQSFLKQAFDLFEKMLGLLKNNNETGIYYLHALEGMAFCYYHLQQYGDAKLELLYMIDFLENHEVENEAWKYRIYNDYGACYYKEGELNKARKVWMMCGQGLAAMGIATVSRCYRNRYNLMLADIGIDENLYIHYKEWLDYQEKILETNADQSSIPYAEMQLLTSWVEGIMLGKTEYALQRANQALQSNRENLQENAYTIAVNHYVISKLYSQEGDQEHAKYCMKKCRNILKNCKLTNQYLKERQLILHAE